MLLKSPKLPKSPKMRPKAQNMRLLTDYAKVLFDDSASFLTTTVKKKDAKKLNKPGLRLDGTTLLNFTGPDKLSSRL